MVTERVSDGTEGNDDVKVLATAADEERKQLQRRQLRPVRRVLVRRRPDCLV